MLFPTSPFVIDVHSHKEFCVGIVCLFPPTLTPSCLLHLLVDVSVGISDSPQCSQAQLMNVDDSNACCFVWSSCTNVIRLLTGAVLILFSSSASSSPCRLRSRKRRWQRNSDHLWKYALTLPVWTQRAKGHLTTTLPPCAHTEADIWAFFCVSIHRSPPDVCHPAGAHESCCIYSPWWFPGLGL